MKNKIKEVLKKAKLSEATKEQMELNKKERKMYPSLFKAFKEKYK